MFKFLKRLFSKKKEVRDIYSDVFKPSSNFKGDIKPKFVILHHSGGSFFGGIDWILSSASRVSYHWFINKDGNRVQFVENTKRAWHAGRSEWLGLNDLNSHSIGIAFSGNTNKRSLTQHEIDSCAIKCIELMKEFEIPFDNILTHAMVAPRRKSDISQEAYISILKRIKQW